MPERRRRWTEALSREWWLVALAVAVAVAAQLAVASSSAGRGSFEAVSRVSVEPKTLSHYYRLPTVDELLVELSSKEHRESLAEGLGLAASDLASLRVYSVMSPQTAIMVSYRSEDASEAARVSEAAAADAVDTAFLLGADEVRQAEEELRLTEEAIQDIESLDVVGDDSLPRWERVDAARGLWAMRLRLEAQRNDLARIEAAYSYEGPSDVRETPPVRALSGTAGAALAGLAAGAVLAALREGLRRRREADHRV